jgi:hypothetical protein
MSLKNGGAMPTQFRIVPTLVYVRDVNVPVSLVFRFPGQWTLGQQSASQWVGIAPANRSALRVADNGKHLAQTSRPTGTASQSALFLIVVRRPVSPSGFEGLSDQIPRISANEDFVRGFSDRDG